MESQTRAIKSMYEALIKLPAGENARGGVSDACNLGFIDLKKKENREMFREGMGFYSVLWTQVHVEVCECIRRITCCRVAKFTRGTELNG